MQIDLLDRDRKRRRRRRKSRTFEDSITLPQPQIGQRSKGRRGQRRPRRAQRPRPVEQSQVAAAEASRRRIALGAILRRVPVVLVLTGLIGVIVYLSSAEAFFVYEAQIRGVRHLDPSVIYEASGMHEQNIFWVQPQKVARRIMELDGVKAARVRCDLLPPGVTIEVEEREPVLVWRSLIQEQDWWLDTEGVALPYGGDPRAPDTIFVVDSSGHDLQVGKRVQPEGIVHSVEQLVAALPEIRILFYHADRGLSFTQQIDGADWPVYVGTSEDLARKIQVLKALTEHFLENNIHPRYVDVRWADYPLYGKPAGQASAGGE